MNGDSMIAPEIRDSPHHLGRELVDIEWILSNQHFAECIQNCILRSEPSDVVMTLADAMDACVGFDFDQRHGVTLHPDPHYLHVCDFDFPALLSRQAAERGTTTLEGAASANAFRNSRRCIQQSLSRDACKR